MDTGSSVDIMFMDCFTKTNSMVDILPVGTLLFGFDGESVRVCGKVKLPMVLGEERWKQNRTITFMLVDTPSLYNVILGRPSLTLYAAIISPTHLMMKFPIENEDKKAVGVGVALGDQQTSRKCYVAVVRSSESHERSGEQRGEEDKEIELQRRKGKETRTTEFEECELMTIELLPEQHGHMVRLGSQLPTDMQEDIVKL